MIQVFKFGGASLRSTEAIHNAFLIIQKFCNLPTIIVISAMDKMTNAFESLHKAWFENSSTSKDLDHIILFHNQIIDQLFPNPHPIREKIQSYYEQIRNFLKTSPTNYQSFDHSYDQLIPFGEILSSCIVFHFLRDKKLLIDKVDAPSCIITDSTWREARINWEKTVKNIQLIVNQSIKDNFKIIITEGFIGSTEDEYKTTLGREGSDFTAAIFAYALNAQKVVIWKDVSGLYNADPKKFKDVIFIPHISYHEAAELSYYGQSIIHPRTIKPLQNKQIPLFIKSFFEPEKTGTIIDNNTSDDNKTPCYIIKENQMLVTISPRDYSFINEMHLSHIIKFLNIIRIRMNVMQNGAISFSFCADYEPYKLNHLLQELEKNYIIKYNISLSLLTIRNYNNEIISHFISDKRIYLEQRSRHTAQFIFSN